MLLLLGLRPPPGATSTADVSGPQEPARGQLLCLEVAAVFRGQIEEGNGSPKQPEGVPPGAG